MAAPRKLSPEEEAAIIAWQSQYRRALSELRKLGTFADKAREYGVSIRTIHTVPNRLQEKIRRCLPSDEGQSAKAGES